MSNSSWMTNQEYFDFNRVSCQFEITVRLEPDEVRLLDLHDNSQSAFCVDATSTVFSVKELVARNKGVDASRVIITMFQSGFTLPDTQSMENIPIAGRNDERTRTLCVSISDGDDGEDGDAMLLDHNTGGSADHGGDSTEAQGTAAVMNDAMECEEMTGGGEKTEKRKERKRKLKNSGGNGKADGDEGMTAEAGASNAAAEQEEEGGGGGGGGGGLGGKKKQKTKKKMEAEEKRERNYAEKLEEAIRAMGGRSTQEGKKDQLEEMRRVDVKKIWAAIKGKAKERTGVIVLSENRQDWETAIRNFVNFLQGEDDGDDDEGGGST
jgi:hypothetical protein